MEVSKTKLILLCLLPGLASVLPILLKGSPVLNNDMLVAYFCYFWDFHKDWSFAHPFPFWSSSYQCGMPMHAYWQSGYLYPVTWILFGPLSPHIGIHLFYAFHFSLGIFGFLKLGPHLRLKPFAAYWAGLCFALSGTMLARYEHATFLAGWAWLPAVLAAFLSLRAAPGPAALARYAACVTLQALGGHPQASAASAILIGGFTAASVARALPGSKAPRPSRGALAWVMGGHLLALAWCLPLLIAFLGLIGRTDRYDGAVLEGAPPIQAGGSWIRTDFDFAKFSTGALRPLHLVSLLAPHALGTPSNGSWWGGEVWGEVFIYIGGLGLLFCGFASFRRANGDMRALWAMGLVGLWISLGPALGASQLQYHIPFFNDFRRPARFLILFVMALAALSAHGFQRWAARPRGLRGLAWAAAAVVPAAAFAFLRFDQAALAEVAKHFPTLKNYDPCAHHYLRKTALLMGRYAIDCAALGVSAAAVGFYARRGRKAMPALFLVLLLDLLRLHWDHFYLFPRDFYRTPPASASVMDASTRPFWRVDHYLEYPGNQMWHMHNDPLRHFKLFEREKAALSCGIHAIFGYRHVSAHLPLLWHWDGPLTPGMKSGRYLFSNRELDVFHGDSLKPLSRFGEVIAYEVEGWRPRLETLRAVPDSSRPETCDAGFSGYRDLCVREPRDGTLSVRGRWNAGDTLLFRERFDAGWRFRVDGGEWKPLQETGGHFMAAKLDRGAVGMDIQYHPGSFLRWTVWIYGLTGLGLLGLFRIRSSGSGSGLGLGRRVRAG